MDAEAIRSLLRRCWSPDSSSQWSAQNPARGQCNATAPVLHDHFGGEILKTPFEGQWHFYNRIGDRVCDLTADQFSSPPAYLDLPSSRDEALAGTTPERYKNLAERFAAALAQSCSEQRP